MGLFQRGMIGDERRERRKERENKREEGMKEASQDGVPVFRQHSGGEWVVRYYD